MAGSSSHDIFVSKWSVQWVSRFREEAVAKAGRTALSFLANKMMRSAMDLSRGTAIPKLE
jgi:hypothetical protein